MKADLEKLLNPSSVMVLGASNNFTKIGGRVMKYLLKFGYKGKIYPVNPKYQDIRDIPCYRSINDIPEQVDVALIAIQAKLVPQTIKECAEHDVRSAIIFSAGFAEIGDKGAENQESLRTLIRQTGMKVCGPNCIGIINFNENTAMSFTGFLETDKLTPGRIGFVSQSGALGGSLLNRAQDRNIGFSYFISTGNEVDLDIVDFMDFMVDDPNTDVIAAYMEQIRDTEKFLRVAERALQIGKPIIVLKVGETETGKRVASSHTGALAGSDIAYSVAFKQNGVIRVDDYDDLIETAMVFSKRQLPRGGKVGIITSTGGGAIIIADKIAKSGLLSLAPLSESTKEKISKRAPSFASIGNPLDLTGQLYVDAQMYGDTLNLLAQDDNVDIVLPIISMVSKGRATDRASCIIHASTLTSKPVVTWWAGGDLSKSGFRLLDESKVALFKSPDRCVKALSSLIAYLQFRKKLLETKAEQTKNAEIVVDIDRVRNLLCTKEGQLTEHEAKLLLSSYDIPVTKEGIATSEEHVVRIASRLGYPVVLKVSSPDIIHKSEAGGVKVDLRTESEIRRSYREILKNCRKYDPSANIEGVLVQEMVTGGTEIIVGVSRDSSFGPMIMFGLGGIFVEILRDISIRILPITYGNAQSMIEEIKAHDILKGARGGRKADTDAIADLLVRVSALATNLSEFISEMDLNPVMVFNHGKGLKVIDALIRKQGEGVFASTSLANRTPGKAKSWKAKEKNGLSVERRADNVKEVGS